MFWGTWGDVRRKRKRKGRGGEEEEVGVGGLFVDDVMVR